MSDAVVQMDMDRREIARLIKSGRLTGHKKANQWYVDDESVRRYLEDEAPDPVLWAIVKQIALQDREAIDQRWAGVELPYTEEEHLAWWGGTMDAGVVILNRADRKLFRKLKCLRGRRRRMDDYED